MAHEVCAIADGLEADQKGRQNRYLLLTSLYEMRPLDSLTAAAYDKSDKYYEEIYIPLARSLCDTVQADIAGRQRVKAQFSTTGADWRTRRRAKKLDQLVEAVFHQEQATYANAWELFDDVFLDETICGAGVTTCYVDDSMGDPKAIIQRRKPGSLKVDPREAENGDPLNFFDHEMFDEDKLIAMFVDADDIMVRDRDDEGKAGEWRPITEEEREARRWAIQDAAMHDDSVTLQQYGTTRIARSVKVRLAWRKPISKDKPGLRAVCIPKCVLDEDDWTRGDPAVVWRWARERGGYWGTGLVEETKSLAAEFNRSMQLLQERMVLCANKRTFIKRGSVAEEELEKNEVENIINVDGDVMPVETQIPPFTPQELEFITLVRQLCFESPGVSLAGATARKEQDVTAGVAIRMLIDKNAQRLVIKAKYGYEQPVVQQAKQLVHAIAEWCEATGKDFSVALPTKRGVKEIKWSEASLDLNKLVVLVYAGSALPDDPAGRTQMVAEAFQQGLMSPATYKRLVAWPDLAAEVDRENAEYEYLESILERYLDATEDEPYQYDPPDGYIMNKAAAMIQFVQAYFVAKRDGAPEFNLQILRRYMLQLGEAIDRAMQPPEQQAGGTPPSAAIGNPSQGMPGAAVPPTIGAAA